MQTQTMTAYLRDIKYIVDQLSAIGRPVQITELVAYVFRGFPHQYAPFVTTLMYTPVTLTLDHLRAKFLSHEQWLMQQEQTDSSSTHMAIFASSNSDHLRERGRGRNGSYGYNYSRGQFHRDGSRFQHSPQHQPCLQQSTLDRSNRGLDHSNRQFYVAKPFHSSQHTQLAAVLPHRRRSSTSSVICQNWGEGGHTTMSCYQGYNQVLSDVPETFAALSFRESNDISWYPDFGTTHHITPYAGILNSLTPYVGSVQVVVGYGAALSIAHIEGLVYTCNERSLHLKNVLHVPSLTHNLLFMPKLCRDNNYAVTFDDCSFVIKDYKTGTMLLHRRTNVPLYPIRFLISSPPRALAASVLHFEIWHARLCYPNTKVLRILQRNHLIHLQSPSKHLFPCHACCTGKSTRLLFFFFTALSQASEPIVGYSF